MRALAFVSAIALVALSWTPAVEALVGGMFPAHMIRHMTLVAIVAPLLVLALPRALPAPPVLLGAIAEFVVVWTWHLPALQGLACTQPVAQVVEQTLFLAAGWAVWAGALRADTPLAGAGGLLLTSMHMTLLGALLTLAPTDLYSASCGHQPSLVGQQLGGMLMLAIGTPAYLIGGLWLTAVSLRDAPQIKGHTL